MNRNLYIGIDFSLQSTGVTFRYEGTTRYLNILNQFALSSSKNFTAAEVLANNDVVNSIVSLPNVTIKPITVLPIPSVKKIGLSAWEHEHVHACFVRGYKVSEAICEIINTIFSHIEKKNIYFALEYYSVGSVTDNLIQVVEATMIMKKILFHERGFILKNLYVVSGPTLKKWVGKGNYDKWDMLNAFMENDKCDDFIEDDPFRLTLYKNVGLYYSPRTKKGKSIKEVKTPISDIIDSYFLALWIEREQDLNN